LTYTTNVDHWYCCLNDAERGSYVLCAAQAGPITYFIIKALFDAYWSIQSGGSITIRKEIFIANWGMTEGEFPPGDPEAIEVYFLSPEIWDDINAYFDEEGTSCAAPCKLRTFPL